MEIVLLWLDELDDLICSLAFLSFRARFGCLQLGLLVALSLKVIPAMTLALMLLLGGIALACVALWSAALGASLMMHARAPALT